VAQQRVKDATIYRRYRDAAVEDWTVFLAPTSVRGQWSGQEPFMAQSAATGTG